MFRKPRSLYLLTHTPTHIHRPLQVGYVEKNEWSDKLFESYMEGVEANRKAGCGRHYLSKRDIERWGFFPPCGARFEVIELDLNWIPPNVLKGETIEETEAQAAESIFKEKGGVAGEKTPEMK